jgi:hypothetical protein
VLKRIYYTLRPSAFPDKQCAFLFVFHVEQMYDDTLFQNLISFCNGFAEETGVEPICALMSGANARVRDGAAKAHVSMDTIAGRMHELAAVATLGYHGHFWIAPNDFQEYESEIRCNNFVKASVMQQVESDLDWFDQYKVPIQPIYSAGWWFVNSDLLAKLAEKGFGLDFSFSHSPWFRNQFSHRILMTQSIPAGEPFRIATGQGDINCVQTLIGCSGPDRIEDFNRNIARLLQRSPRTVMGALCSHDYDLRVESSLRCISALAKNPSVRILGYQELKAIDTAALRTVRATGSL